MSLRPLGVNILAEELEQPRQTESGIMLDFAKSVNEVSTFKVLAVGEDVKGVAEGDLIIPIISKAYSSTYKGKKIFLIKDEDVLAVVR